MTEQDELQESQEPIASPLSAPEGYPFPTDAEGLLAWSHAEQLLAQAHSYWLAITLPRWSAHDAALACLGLMARSTLMATPRTRWARNIPLPIPMSPEFTWKAATMWSSSTGWPTMSPPTRRLGSVSSPPGWPNMGSCHPIRRAAVCVACGHTSGAAGAMSH